MTALNFPVHTQSQEYHKTSNNNTKYFKLLEYFAFFLKKIFEATTKFQVTRYYHLLLIVNIYDTITK